VTFEGGSASPSAAAGGAPGRVGGPQPRSHPLLQRLPGGTRRNPAPRHLPVAPGTLRDRSGAVRVSAGGQEGRSGSVALPRGGGTEQLCCGEDGLASVPCPALGHGALVPGSRRRDRRRALLRGRHQSGNVSEKKCSIKLQNLGDCVVFIIASTCPLHRDVVNAKCRRNQRLELSRARSSIALLNSASLFCRKRAFQASPALPFLFWTTVRYGRKEKLSATSLLLNL